MMDQLHEAVQNYSKKRWTHSYLKLTSIYLRMLYCLNVLLWFYLGMYIKKIGTSSNQATNSRQPVRTSPNQFGQPDRNNQIGPASSDHQKKCLLIPATSEGPWVPVGKLMKSTFQPNKFRIISTSRSGFIIESLKTAQNVKSLPEDLSCSNSCPKLYHSTMFHGSCHTFLESLSSLVSHPTNGLSFWLPSREKWSFYWRLRRSPGDARELKMISWMLHLLAFHLPTWRI